MLCWNCIKVSKKVHTLMSFSGEGVSTSQNNLLRGVLSKTIKLLLRL